MTVEASAGGAARNGRIAFKRYFDPQADTWSAIVTVDADGTHERQITHPARGISDDQPSWSADGTQLVFTRCPEGTLCHTYRVRADGSGLAPIGKPCPAGATETTCADEAWATLSRGGQVALTASTGVVKTDSSGEGWIERSALTVMKLDGTARRVVYQLTGNRGDVGSPAFSPNGRQLAFEVVSSGFSQRPHTRAVFVVGVDGSGLRRLTPWKESSGDHPTWSPDGRWILFHTHVEDSGAQAQYAVVHPDGTGRKTISSFPSGTSVASAGFSPDGTSIVLSKGPEGGNVDVWTMRLDGSGLTRITRSARWESAPDWARG